MSASPQSATSVTTLGPNATGLLGATVLGAIIMSPALTIYGSWGRWHWMSDPSFR